MTDDEAKEALRIAYWYILRRCEQPPFSIAILETGSIEDLVQETMFTLLHNPPKAEIRLTTRVCKIAAWTACRKAAFRQGDKRRRVEFQVSQLEKDDIKHDDSLHPVAVNDSYTCELPGDLPAKNARIIWEHLRGTPDKPIAEEHESFELLKIRHLLHERRGRLPNADGFVPLYGKE